MCNKTSFSDRDDVGTRVRGSDKLINKDLRAPIFTPTVVRKQLTAILPSTVSTRLPVGLNTKALGNLITALRIGIVYLVVDVFNTIERGRSTTIKCAQNSVWCALMVEARNETPSNDAGSRSTEFKNYITSTQDLANRIRYSFSRHCFPAKLNGF